MKTVAISAVFALLFVAAAQAQSVDIVLSAAPGNISSCSSGDSTWAKKWTVTVAGDKATVSGGTPVTMKKTADGVFQEQLRFANSTFDLVFEDKGKGRSLKVKSKNLGCTWQGSAP